MRCFCILLCCYLLAISLPAQQPGVPIRLKNGAINRSHNLQQEKSMLPFLKKVQYNNKYYVLLQFSETPADFTRLALSREGIVLRQYLPGKAFLAEMDRAPDGAALRKHGITGVFTREPAARIAPELPQLLSRQVSDPEQLIAVHLYAGFDRAVAVMEIKKAGARIVNTKFQPANVVFVDAPMKVVEQLATLPFVVYLNSQSLKEQVVNYQSRAAHGAGLLGSPAGRGLRGAQVTLGIGDDADPSSHIDFSGRLINRFPLTPSTHGTHTAGTMAGGGILNPRYSGMAPEATVISQFFSDVLVNAPYYVSDFNMVLTNNSYYSGLAGCEGEGDYDVLSNYIDAQLREYPALLHVFAAGNDGALACAPYPPSFATIKSGFQSAKNVLTVGAINTPDNTIAPFSSRGPVDDGRIKPEIVAGGAGITSTIPNNGYGKNWGTSMAAPAVTGTLALLYERFRQLHGGADPPAALIKAMACNTADDLGPPGPDFTFGYGSLNARSAVEGLEGNHYFLDQIKSGETITHTIPALPAGMAQVKIMLYWHDPPAAPYAATSLVNNLDLRVTTGTGTIHYPLVLNSNAAGVNNVAAEGVDNSNNMEQVVIAAPPAGDLVISVSGSDLPFGPQEFVVVYQVIPPALTIIYPSGGETLVPGEQDLIRWSATGSNTNAFTAEYSVNGGTSWVVIHNNIDGAARTFPWNVPNLPTGQALIRVSRNSTGYTGVSDYAFVILGQPVLTATNPCPGYVQLNWPAIVSATQYEVMALEDGVMRPVALTTGTGYLLEGVRVDSPSWLAVRALKDSVRGRRSLARQIIPSGGNCALPAFENDLAVDSLLAPVTGRMYTASQPGVAAPSVRIRNLGSTPTSGTYQLSYQVNGGPVVTEYSDQVIAPAGSYTHTFSAAYDFSAAGTYLISAWVDYIDTFHANDTLVAKVRHLRNDPVVLAPAYTEGFETAAAKTYYRGTTGFEGLDRADFHSNSPNGRARTFVNTALARTGNRAITLDRDKYSALPAADSLITTFNLAEYASGAQLWLDCYYLNHGTQSNAAGNQIWIRGSETDNWIPVFALPVEAGAGLGRYQAMQPVNITRSLSEATPAQTVSSSFQVKFGQEGFTSANSITAGVNLDNGFSFDDLKISLANNDLHLTQIVAPDPDAAYAPGPAAPVVVRLENLSDSILQNVAVSYCLNGDTVTENIPFVAARQALDYTFHKKADLSAYATYSLQAWVSAEADSYRDNDSLLIEFTTVPLITGYPYLQQFESDNGNWYTNGSNSSWQWGSPAGANIYKAANGQNAWVTSLGGNYNNSELSYLYSPCFDLSNLQQPVISFSHIFFSEANCTCDLHWLEYSLDGKTWVKLGEAGLGTNWYDSPAAQAWQSQSDRWQVASYAIPEKGSRTRFRFVMQSDMALSYEGVGIDDIHIFDRTGIYAGANIPGGLSRQVAGEEWVHFEADGRRIVSVHANGQDLGETTVKTYLHTGPVRHNGYQYYLDRNIVVQPEFAPAGPVSVRYYFRAAEADNLIHATGCADCHTINDAYEAGITQYEGSAQQENGTVDDNDSGSYRFIPPGEVAVIPYDDGYYAEFRVSSFSEFWINSGGPRQNMAFPQIVDSFRVRKENETALLQWVTWKERSTHRFVVERSADSVIYSAIGELPAGGNSDLLREYQFTDPKILPGSNLYRIVSVDEGGSRVYSPVRWLYNGDNELHIVDSFWITSGNGAALLQWRTLQERNTAKYIIERKNEAGLYEVIGELPANGNLGWAGYQFIDAMPAWGINYYRIKTLNSTGQSVYSPERMFNNTGNRLNVRVYPNPVQGALLYIHSNADLLRLELRDVTGRILVQTRVQGREGRLPVRRYGKGIYFLTVVTKAGTHLSRIVIE